MGDDFAIKSWAGVRAALLADAGVAALVGARVVDEPGAGIALPYIRLGRLEPVADDTDGTQGALVQMGLEAHSRPLSGGRIEALRICEAMRAALHRRPDLVTVTGANVCEVEVQTFTATRAADGSTYLGILALAITLD